MDDELNDAEGLQFPAAETGWVRELARDASLTDGETFAILVHLSGRPTQGNTVPVFDLFLDPLPDRHTVVRRRKEEDGRLR